MCKGLPLQMLHAGSLTNPSQFVQLRKKRPNSTNLSWSLFLATLFCFYWSQSVMAICSRWRSSDSFTKCELLLPFVLLSTLWRRVFCYYLFQLFIKINIWVHLIMFKWVVSAICSPIYSLEESVQLSMIKFFNFSQLFHWVFGFDLRDSKLVWLLRRFVIFLKIYRVFRFDFRFQTFVIAKTSYWPNCSINIFHWEKTKNCWQPTSNWNNGSFEVH